MNNKYKEALDLYINNYHNITVGQIIQELEDEFSWFNEKTITQLSEHGIDCDDFALERIAEYLYDEYLNHECLHPCDEYFLQEYLSSSIDKFIEDIVEIREV